MLGAALCGQVCSEPPHRPSACCHPSNLHPRSLSRPHRGPAHVCTSWAHAQTRAVCRVPQRDVGRIRLEELVPRVRRAHPVGALPPRVLLALHRACGAEQGERAQGERAQGARAQGARGRSPVEPRARHAGAGAASGGGRGERGEQRRGAHEVATARGATMRATPQEGAGRDE